MEAMVSQRDQRGHIFYFSEKENSRALAEGELCFVEVLSCR